MRLVFDPQVFATLFGIVEPARATLPGRYAINKYLVRLEPASNGQTRVRVRATDGARIVEAQTTVTPELAPPPRVTDIVLHAEAVKAVVDLCQARAFDVAGGHGRPNDEDPRVVIAQDVVVPSQPGPIWPIVLRTADRRIEIRAPAPTGEAPGLDAVSPRVEDCTVFTLAHTVKAWKALSAAVNKLDSHLFVDAVHATGEARVTSAVYTADKNEGTAADDMKAIDAKAARSTPQVYRAPLNTKFVKDVVRAVNLVCKQGEGVEPRVDVLLPLVRASKRVIDSGRLPVVIRAEFTGVGDGQVSAVHSVIMPIEFAT